MRPSHYASYIYERLGKSILEDERGFATYFYVQDMCYIEDIYVQPKHRQSKVASEYANQIAAEARLKGSKRLMGSVNLKAKNGTNSMKVLLAYGFELDFCDNNQMIYLKKELM